MASRSKGGGPVIQLKSLSVRFPMGAPWQRRQLIAVDDLELVVEAGETVGLVGESGSGKSTVGRVCLGLQEPSSGECLFEGRPLGRSRKAQRGLLAAVLQNPAWSLNPRLRIENCVGEPLRVQTALSAKERSERVSEILDSVGLDPSLGQRLPGELSGGQRQRVALARALVTEPRFILFDEATSALDVSVQAQILNLIRDLQSSHGFAALFISHDLAAVRYVSHRIAVMYAGHVVEMIPPQRRYSAGRHPYTRCLQQASELLDEDGFELAAATAVSASSACVLAPRCPLAAEICRTETPPLQHCEGGYSLCHRAQDLS